MWDMRPYKLVGVVKHLTLLFVKSFFLLELKTQFVLKL